MKNKPKLFFITGISGSGKTTVARKLCEIGEVAFDSKIQKGLFYFSDSNGNAPEKVDIKNQEWRERYKWVLNKPMLDELINENISASRVFLCGGSDDIEQYWPIGEKVFLLCVDADTMISRLNREDRDNVFGKDLETQKALVERIDRFQKRLIDSGAIEIDATKSIDDVVHNILSEAN